MMGGETPETCWATHKRQVINLWNCCILLVNLFESYDDARAYEHQIYNCNCVRFFSAVCILSCYFISSDYESARHVPYSESQITGLKICVALLVFQLEYAITKCCQILDSEHGTSFMQLLLLRNSPHTFSCASSKEMTVPFVFTTTCPTVVIFCFFLTL